jgi:hypothetical protein
VSELPLARGSWATQTPLGSRFYQMLAASLLVHLVLTPAPALLGLLGAFGSLVTEELPPEEELTGIPVDLIAEEPSPAAPTEPPQAEPARLPPEDPASPAVALPAPSPAAPEPLDPRPTAPESQKPEPQKPDPAAKDGGDPVALAGAAGKLADSNANVRILLYTDVVRNHPLGARIGGLLKRSPQWSDFFGPTDVDPIRDIDRVLIAGPELRDTKNIVAVIGHHLSEEQIDVALERLVARNGEWISRSPRLARATADRATRLFAAPRDGIVAVAPPSVEKSLKKLGQRLAFPDAPPGTAAHVYIKSPSRPLRALGLRLPDSIAWLSIRVVPEANGGVLLRLEAQDESEALASEHAESLEVLLRRASEIDLSKMGAMGALAAFALGASKQKVVESIELVARADHIEGLVRVTGRQLQNLADVLDAVLPPPAAPSGPRMSPPEEPAVAPATGGAAPSAPEGAEPAERSPAESPDVPAEEPNPSPASPP